MIRHYYWPTPNGHKTAIMLEEVGLPSELHPVNILAGEQFEPEFIAELEQFDHPKPVAFHAFKSTRMLSL